jgi:hypothetical protein
VFLSGSDTPASDEFAVFCGLDVGKGAHHACALDRAGQRVYDQPLPNDEAALREVLSGWPGMAGCW